MDSLAVYSKQDVELKKKKKEIKKTVKLRQTQSKCHKYVCSGKVIVRFKNLKVV